MKQKEENQINRRAFIKNTSFVTAGVLLTKGMGYGQLLKKIDKPDSKVAGVQIGVTTYSYISLPDYLNDVTGVLQYVVDSKISAVELKGEAVEGYLKAPKDKEKLAKWRAELPLDRFDEIRQMFDEKGVSIYAFKPANTLERANTDAEIKYAMRAAKRLGASSVTLELPDPAQTLRLGRIAEQEGILVGYHTHLQATDTVWDEAMRQSPQNTINLDVGHYIAAGGENTPESLLNFIKTKHDKISSMHLKDRRNAENGGKNQPWGEGDTPIKEILHLIRDNKYDIPVTIELEYPIPEGSNAIKEVENCFEYAKKILLL